MRLFAAVRPPGEVLDHLAAALGALGVRGDGGPADGVRWTAEENWHLTLAFYGEVPDGAVDEVLEGLGAVAATHAPFPLRLRGAGVFAHRTLWVGAGGDVDAMAALAAAATGVGLDVTGREDDRVRHRAHLTIGRVVAERTGRDRRSGRSPEQVRAVVHALAVYSGPEWLVDHLVLVRSRPGEGRSGGPLYDDLARLPLRGSSAVPVAP